MFLILIWQDSCSSCPTFPAHVFSGWLFWLFMYYFAMPQALFVSVLCILPSSPILLTFFCNWETSQFLPRPFSFFGITCSLIVSNHFPVAPLGLKCNVRLLKDFEEITLNAAEQQSPFNHFSLSQCPQSHRGLSFVLKSYKVFWFALNYSFEQKGG